MSQLRILTEGLGRYVEGHIETGSFLRSVLENDLAGAVLRGDPESVALLRDLVIWLQSFAPPACWGNPEKVRAWLAVCQNCSHPFAEHGPEDGCRHLFTDTATRAVTYCVCTARPR